MAVCSKVSRFSMLIFFHYLQHWPTDACSRQQHHRPDTAAHWVPLPLGPGAWTQPLIQRQVLHGACPHLEVRVSLQGPLLQTGKVFIMLCMCVLSHQSCLTLCYPMDCRLPGSSVLGILQARILQWVVMPSSKASSWPRDRTWFNHANWPLFIISPILVGVIVSCGHCLSGTFCAEKHEHSGPKMLSLEHPACKTGPWLELGFIKGSPEKSGLQCPTYANIVADPEHLLSCRESGIWVHDRQRGHVQ